MPTLKRPTKRPLKSPANPPDTHPAQYHERMDSLFAELDRLANDPTCEVPELHERLSVLRTRLHELEARLPQTDESPEPALPETPARNASPIIYERDQVGYIYAQDNLQEIHSNEALAGVKPAAAAPITAGGQAIGAVQVGSSAGKESAPITPDTPGILNTVAQQASLQIQNLRLLAETERARAEAEAANHRFMHESWDTYLDAIHQNERIGYTYDQAAVEPFTGQPERTGLLRATVNVLEEQIGELYVRPDPDHPLKAGDEAIVSAVARQVAQQVEAIRLLADASRARTEADDTLRRVTRENWAAYAEQEDKPLAFVYDSNQVSALGDRTIENLSMAVPLLVRDEAIGELAIAGVEALPPEAAAIASAIAHQASLHLETLRLNDELRQRAAQLMELDRLKSGFLANMSHELRTPLNSILGFSDVILDGLDGPLTPNMNTDLGLIQKNGRHLLHLINDVLDMAKIEAGRMNLSPETMILSETIEEVTSITSTLASEKNLALFIEPGSDREVEIIADRTRIRQVMINLVNNAIKFTDRGQISIRVTRQGADKVLIAVRDTGSGIPPEKLEVIFQEFTQVDTSSTRKAGGTGLGLPISRRLIEMHGGRLWAESKGIPGEGSIFYVELPLVAQLTDVVEKKDKKA